MARAIMQFVGGFLRKSWWPLVLLFALLAAVPAGARQIVVVGEVGTAATSSDGLSWTLEMQSLRGIAHGGDQWIAVGEGGTILTSPDGIAWTSHFTGVIWGLNAIAYRAGQWLVVGDQGTVLTSSDGASWTVRGSLCGCALNDLIYDGTQWIVVGDGSSFSGNIFTSPDGITWTNRQNGPATYLRGIAYDGTQWIIADRYTNSPIMVSPDGIEWTGRGAGQGNFLESIAHHDGQWTTVGDNGAILTSSDGITWTTRASGTTQMLHDVDHDGHQWLAVGNSGTILTSPDGITWTSHGFDEKSHLQRMAYDGTQWIAVGQSWDSGFAHALILTSPDGFAWTVRAQGTSNALSSVAFNGSTWMSVGKAGAILSSPNGMGWLKQASGVASDLRAIDSDSTQWLAVGQAGTILSSRDSIHWSHQASGTSNDLNGLAYNGTEWIAVGQTGGILASRDGTTWEVRSSGTTNTLYGVAFNATGWVAVGQAGTILTSPDGIGWRTENSGATTSLHAIAWNGTEWLTVGGNGGSGATGTLLTSTDASTWTVQRSQSQLPVGAADDGRQWIAVGDAVYTSPDGVSWTYRYGPRSSLNGIATDLRRHDHAGARAIQLWDGGILSNGIISIGVHHTGILGVYGPASKQFCTSNWVTLRYLPTVDEAMDCDFEGEGWGVGYLAASGQKVSSFTIGYGARTPSVFGGISEAPVFVFGSTDQQPALKDHETGTVVHQVQDLLVNQTFAPHPGVSQAYDDTITFTNVGAAPIQDVLYRRAMSFASARSGSDVTYMTLATMPGTPFPPEVLHTSTTGQVMSSLDPWQPWTAAVGCLTGYSVPCNQPTDGPPANNGVYDNGPADSGAGWDLKLPGALNPGESKSFVISYGAGANRADAMQVLAAVQAQVYALSVGITHQLPTGIEQDVGNTRDDSIPSFFMSVGHFRSSPPHLAALFSIVPPAPCTTAVVQFADAGSTISTGGMITSWTYSFGDGTGPVKGPKASHVFPDRQTYTIHYTVSDSFGHSATAVQAFTPPESDCPPELKPIPDQVVRLGNPAETICFVARDPDDTDAQLLWQVEGLPTGARVNDDHCLNWKPGEEQLGHWPMHVRVCDRHACAEQGFWIIVWTPPPSGTIPPCADYDHDGVCDPADNCPGIPNYAQADGNGNGIGDACERLDSSSGILGENVPGWKPLDKDRDGVADTADNCPSVVNRDQRDTDSDGIGDACDPDLDGDGVSNTMATAPTDQTDNCALIPNPDQLDDDGNGIGNACESARYQSSWHQPETREVNAVPSVSVFPSGLLVRIAAALTVGMGLLAALFWTRAKAVLFVLFSRLAGMDVLQHPVRARIMQQIAAKPGISYQGIVNGLNLSYGAFEHHVGVLLQAGFVQRLGESRRLRYYPVTKDPVRDLPPGASQIITQVELLPGQSLADLARTLGTTRMTAWRRAQRLAEQGHIRLQYRGRRVFAYPRESPEEAMR